MSEKRIIIAINKSLVRLKTEAGRQARMKNNITTKAAMTLIAVGLLVLVFCIGTRFAQTIYEPQTTVDTNANINTDFSTTVESRVIATHTVEYIEKPVTEVKYVERVTSVPVELRNFTNLEELKHWIEGRNKVTTVRFQSDETLVDCDDYAFEMQQKALADGYVMSFQIIEPDTYNSLFENKLPPNTLHAINLVLIGNTAHYIEPQTGEVAFAAHLD
ncbi:hypothetical protein ACFLXO_08265 [Chloroflexota bacterium]